MTFPFRRFSHSVDGAPPTTPAPTAPARGFEPLARGTRSMSVAGQPMPAPTIVIDGKTHPAGEGFRPVPVFRNE